MEKDDSWTSTRSNVTEPVAVHGEIITRYVRRPGQRRGCLWGAPQRFHDERSKPEADADTNKDEDYQPYRVHWLLCKRGIYPYITDNDRAGKLFKFGWV